MITPARYALVGVLAVTGAVLHVTAEDVLLELAAEDGALEDLQAAAYLLAVVVCVRGLVRGTASRWALVVGAGALLLCGEEISWGQRLFGYDGPAVVEARNRQHGRGGCPVLWISCRREGSAATRPASRHRRRRSAARCRGCCRCRSRPTARIPGRIAAPRCNQGSRPRW